MNLAKFSLERKNLTYFTAILLALSGVMSYLQMGWLEDPDFSIKVAAIIVDYPGATPEEVELEVVEVIETKLQEMPQLKHVSSLSRDGRAIIKAEIKDDYWEEDLPQVWDELRRKIRDIKPYLPQGAHTPVIRDDFGFVFGFILAITSDGFEPHELEVYAKDIRRELSLLPEIARIDLWGVQQRQVFVEFSAADVAEFGVTGDTLMHALQSQNKVVDAGLVDVGRQQYTLKVTGELNSLEDISNVLVAATSAQGKSQLVRLGDIAHLSYGYQDPPANLLRNNGRPAIALAMAPIQGSNVVNVGRLLDRHLTQLQTKLPIGIEFKKVAWQSDYVADGVNSFMVNLVEAILIVFTVLSLTMGLRMGLLIGAAGLGLTVLGSLALMNALDIDLHRVSLGALVVAMGMMVDNAIVVADGFVVRIRQGMERVKAAQEAAQQTSLPLLGATIVAIMAFYPIFASTDNAGEYARALFIVVGLALMLSWVISQTIIPLLCVYWIPAESQKNNGATAPLSKLLNLYRSSLMSAMRRRGLFLLALAGLLLAAISASPWMKTQFFPDAVRNQFMVDYWAPEGTRLPTVAQDLTAIEQQLMDMPNIVNVSSFIGQGPPRFYLPVDPEMPTASYAQLLVTTNKATQVDKIVQTLQQWLDDSQPQALIRVRKFGVGTSDTWPINIRIIGPSDAAPDTLRHISDQVSRILQEHPNIRHVNTDWRQRTLQIESRYNLQEGGWIGISREDVADATKRTLDGQTIGLLREGDKRLPIVVRTGKSRQTNTLLEQIQVRARSGKDSVPLTQINKETLFNWEDPIIQRYDRRRTISVQAVASGKSTLKVIDEIMPTLQTITLPAGYALEQAGEYQSSNDARQSLLPGVPAALCVMALIVVGLFNAFRPALIIFAIVPFAVIGIIFGHMLTGVPLGFISILGGFSLSGMMIKNSVVLLDQVSLNKQQGMDNFTALMDAAESRLLPVVNASLTTILGMLPLLQDAFWQSIAITIMFGLIFGTLLTMFVLPVLYVVLYRIKPVLRPT